jgi:hypothetical protein
MSKPDKNYEGIASNSHPVSISDATIQPDDGSQYDDILKFSNAWAVTVSGCEINPMGGNREDGVDINNHSRELLFRNCRVTAGAKYAFTIKGGSRDITLKDITIKGPRGSEGVDIDIGNYSDQSNVMTRDITLDNVNREDGQPVTIRIGRGKDVNITNSNVKILVFQSLLLKVYVWAKFNLVRLINKIKGLIK